MLWWYFLLPMSCYVIGVICGRLSVKQGRDDDFLEGDENGSV